MKRSGIAWLLSLCPVFAVADDIYTCVENGVTKFSQTPCGPTPLQSQLYHPNAPAIEFSEPMNVPLSDEQTLTTKPVSSFHQLKQLKVSAERCELKGIKGYYSGLIKNSARKKVLEVKLEVTFDFEKDGRLQSSWDHKSKLLRLTPGQTLVFELESRLLPPDSEVYCHAVWQGRVLGRP